LIRKRGRHHGEGESKLFSFISEPPPRSIAALANHRQKEITMKKIGMLALALLLFTVNGYAQSAKVVITTGGIGGVYYYYGTQVSEILSKNNVASATAIQTAASVDNMLLLRDKSDPAKSTYFIGTVLPDTAYFTVTGKHEKFAEKPSNFRLGICI